MTAFLQIGTVVAALGSGLIAGVFFAFSTFVMAGLAQLPPAEGLAAMQSINRTAVRPPLMAVLFGTALACLGLAVWAVLNWGERSAGWVLAGAALYVIGAIVVTIVANVSRNEALALLDPGDPGTAELWVSYVASWTGWNHVRTLASLGAAALLTVALLRA